MLVSVAPTLPGLINSINPSIKVGGAVYVFDIAWLFGVRIPLLLLPSYRFFANGVDLDLVLCGFWSLLDSVYFVPGEGNDA